MAAGAGMALAGGLRGAQVWAAPGVLSPGTRPDPAKPEGTDTLPQVEHIVIYMQENHSYDSYFGMLDVGDGYTLSGGVPTNSVPDPGDGGNPFTVFHTPDTCQPGRGVSQSWNATHKQFNGGAMDGFLNDGNTNAMKYWDESQLPFYYDLARTFPLCDRWFASAPCQTYPNRRFLQAATSVGIIATDTDAVLATPSAPNGTIWERLNDHGISWNDYSLDLPDILLFPDVHKKSAKNLKSIQNFLWDAEHGTLPQVSIISPGFNSYTEENPHDIALGEAYSARMINAVMQGPGWDKTVMFFTYDEHGGYYDHVPPPPAVAPDSIKPDIHVPPDEPGAFDRYGFRVPSFVISPWGKTNHVSSTVYDHTSILKFIETKFNLGALTYRDANANDLLDTLDFSTQAFADPPTLAEPAFSGTSACEPDIADPKSIKAVQAPATPTTTTTTAPGGVTTTTAVGAGGAGTPGAPGAAPVPGEIAFTGRDVTTPTVVGVTAVATGFMFLAAKAKLDAEREAAWAAAQGTSRADDLEPPRP